MPFNLLTFRIPLGNWNVDEAYDKFVFGIWKAKNGVQDLVQTNRAAQIFAEAKSESVSVIKKLISLLLYLCTEQPEIIDRKEPEWHPAFPRPKTIKGELRYFPATKQHVFEVGESLGQELRQQREQLPSAPTGRHVRSHFRRGHWQGYWYGPRKNANPGSESAFLNGSLPYSFTEGRMKRKRNRLSKLNGVFTSSLCYPRQPLPSCR